MKDRGDSPEVGVSTAPDVTILTTAGNKSSEARNNEKLDENSSLSPVANQTYFAEEKIHIPEIDTVG